MISTDYKKEAHKLYRNNQFLEAYQCAWNLPFTNFVSWFTDVQGNKNRGKGVSFFNNPFFYNSFLITQSNEWLSHKEAILLWEYYLNTQKKIAIEFELFIAHNNPSLYIEGYKNRLVFLNDNRLSQLQEQNLPSPIENELKIWNRFNNLLNQKWNKIEELFDNKRLLPHEICMAIIASFETFIYKNQNDKLQWHYAVETLSLIIAYIQNKYDLANVQVDKKALSKAYYENVFKLKGKAIFNEAFEYVLLKEKTQRYIYEPDFSVFIDKKDTLRFRESDAFNRQWKYDEHRYTVNEQYYYAFGEQQTDTLKAASKIKFINNNKDSNNQLGNARQLAIKQAIYDLGISDDDIKNNKLPNLNFMISFLHGLAWRKFETSAKPLHAIARVRKNEYAKGMVELIQKNKISEFVLISETNVLYNAAKASGLNCTIQEFNRFINAFSFNWKVKTFDPYRLSLYLWKKPFLQIGKHVISPISVLTGFTGLYTISESILKNFIPREGKRVENILKGMYENESWKTSLLKENQEYGDVDVVMEDDKNIIFIQLKRTSQKIDMLGLSNQLPQDRKAIKQLIEAKAGNVTNKNIHLWYVTTAFEKVGTRENEVYRVSYQDLIHIKRLLNSERLRFNQLNDFIELIESDKPYKISKEYILKQKLVNR